MDYDENDFQNQNHHLAGDGNNKFPPVLNPYALPKFDFDDSLPGHLRFDSLVETEGFLGIENNEDNRWIEDFSRGSCGIDFTKSAADSCSISRCNNVWSEATSSESVEMLLKSVGHEETVPRQNVAEVSDAFDELGCLTKRMEPDVRPDAIFTKIGDVGDLQPAVAPEEVPEDSSGLKNDMGADQSRVEVSLQDHGESVEKDSTNIDLDTGGKLGLSAEGYLFDGETSINVSGRDVGDVVIDSAKNDAKEDITCSEVKVDDATRDSGNIAVKDNLKTQEDPHPTSDASIKDENNLRKDNDLLSKELLALENEKKVNIQNSGGDTQNVGSDEMNRQNSNINAVESITPRLDAPLDSTVEGIKEGNAGRTVFCTVVETSVLEVDTGSATVQESVEEACGGTTIQACIHQNAPLKDAGSTDQLNENVHMESQIVLEADKDIDGHPLEVVNSERGIDSCPQRDHVEEKDKSVDDQLVGGEIEGNSMVSSYSAEVKAGNFDADTSRTRNSVEAQMDNVGADTIGNSKVQDSVKDTNVENRGLSSSQTGTTEARDVNGRGDTPNPCSVPVSQEESIVLLPALGNKDGTIGVPVVTDKGFGVPSVSESGNNQDVIADHEEVHISAEVVLRSTHLDDRNDAEVEASRGDLPAHLSESNAAVAQGSHSELVETARGAFNDQSPPPDTSIPECTPVAETGNPESLCESQAAEMGVTLDGSSTMELTVNLMDVTSKGDSSAEAAITPERPAISTPQEKCEMESKVSGDASKPLESTVVSAGRLPEGQLMSKEPEDGRDCHNSDQTNSDTRVTSGTSSLSVSGKEKGGSEIPRVQDVGIIGSEESSGKGGPGVPGPKQNDAPKAEKSSAVKIVEAPPPTAAPVQTASRVQRSGKRGSPQTADKENKSSKGTPDRKPRRASTKSAGRESAKKGNSVKEARPLEQSELVVKSINVSLGPPGMYQLVQPKEILHHGQIEGLGTKPFGALTTPPSSLPDLNSSAFPSVVFQQPFNDMQQVQLRAQILVYGSLISRLVPEELHMVSAFGGPDGGRSLWEKAWQTCKARTRVQTPHQINLETPTSSRSGDLASDPASKQSKVTPSPAARASTSGTPTPSINPMIPLSSPLWSLPTPSLDALQSSGLPRGVVVDYQPAFPKLAPHQTQPILSYVGQNTSWMSQTPFRGPWAAAPQNPALNTSIRFPSVATESVQLTPVRESSLAFSSGMKHTPPGPSAQGGGPPGATVGVSPAVDLAKVIMQSDQSGDPKSKKRKKGPPSEDRSRINLQSQSHAEKLLIPAATSIPSASVTATTPASFQSKGTTLEFNAVVSPTPSTALDKEADQGKKKPVLSEEAIGKVKEAMQQAENAAALAASAVSHSEEVWNELDKKNISGSVSASEAKLASAAVAIAAAAAVAKAAAAAANVASNAALQAKAMADEALSSDPDPSEGNSRGVIWSNSSSSIIFAAKEAARRRVEAASAAALRAENLDIVVKAAELAAEAISQAGKVVTMGDPLSLSKLAEAGPEGFWKLPQFSSEQASMVRDANVEQANNENLVAGSIGLKKSSEGPADNCAAHSNQHVPSNVSKDILRNPMEDQVRLIVGLSGSVSPGDKDRMGEKLANTSDATEITGVNPESQSGLRSQDIGVQGESNKAAGAKKDYGIQEGSRVEVFKDEDGYKGAWFAADVMSLKDGKASVCYTELPSIEGSGKLQEWVDLEGAGDKAPRIRIPHPMTAVQLDGSKKRRRAAMGSFTCSVGDKVDAWIEDSWWEGVVTEKKDETSVMVQLPVLGETSVVRTWHLRPSLIWMDGKWIEWSSTREDDRSHHEGDTPKEKRAKLGSSGRQAKGKGKALKTVEVQDSDKTDGSKLLDLSVKEKVFNIGKSNKDEGKPDPPRTIRSGLRKQGPGVIFGVPKPGKKRKFMEVSKHYVEDQSNNKAEVSDSVKLANYLMPRGSGPRGLKNAPRTDVRGKEKGKEDTESKTKVPATVRSRGLSGRTVSQRNGSKISVSAPGDTSVTDRGGKIKDPSGHVGKHNSMGAGSFSSSEAATGGSFSFSSQAPSDVTTSRKISAPKSDSMNKEKPASTSGRLARIEEDKSVNSNSEAEPRRSNRRIQPTSRLLEGLQSSLIISKGPSSTHDKGHRSARSGAKGYDSGRE
ncbi:uncharacterized protein LOC116205406 isoform X1 [Punica granatum]|uniref:Uncharacterized protein LOC116205406 isoform X1 n=1 Tax=Punica granatum TaxID=22663 RepID=A0A6P8D9S5_PUNGR|nr:uncharacterized protein LOC116205406 isoform X1 [Punica granatum]XP_031393870.1 uncharacterized protein LOC116205406 isoform X1 [Punica granatum]XP_031393871.1 uncharacterized protein LOC116205406 isoform X1 [Punica granatum]XP_031393872.1 uncharacterized protein LOC116205406 isoform X1 [Punica granatum]